MFYRCIPLFVHSAVFVLAYGCLVRSNRRVSTIHGALQRCSTATPHGLFVHFLCVSLHTIFELHFCSRHEFTQYFLSHFVKLPLIASVPFCFLPLRRDLSFHCNFRFSQSQGSVRCYLYYYSLRVFSIFFIYAVDAYILTSMLSIHTVHAICVHRKIQKTSLCIQDQKIIKHIIRHSVIPLHFNRSIAFL